MQVNFKKLSHAISESFHTRPLEKQLGVRDGANLAIRKHGIGHADKKTHEDILFGKKPLDLQSVNRKEIRKWRFYKGSNSSDIH